MKRVITHPLTYNSIDDVIEELSMAIQCGRAEEFMAIFPTSQLFHEVRWRLLQREIKGYGDLRLLSFDDLVTSLLEVCGIRRRLLSDVGRELLISRIIQGLSKEGRLRYFRPILEFKGFVLSMVRALGEMKRACVTPEGFLKAVKGSAMQDKYMDLYLIYHLYQEELKASGLVDREERYILARRLLKDEPKAFSYISPLKKVIMAEFHDFNQLQLGIVEALSDQVPEIEIYLPFEDNREEVYAHVAPTLAILTGMGFTREERTGSGCEPQPPEALRHIQEGLFQLTVPPLGRGDGLSLTCAPDMAREIRECGRKIKGLIVSGKYRPADICLLVRELSDYVRIIAEEFQELGIPSTLSREEKLMDHPLVRVLIKLLQIGIEGWSRDSVLKVAKSQYIGRALQLDGDLLELLAAPYIIKSRASWLSLLEVEMAREEGERGPEVPWAMEGGSLTLRTTQQQVKGLKEGFQRLAALVEKFPASARPLEYTAAMREVLRDLHLYENLLGLYVDDRVVEVRSEPNLRVWAEEFKRDLSALTGVKESLELLDAAFKDSRYEESELSIEEFLNYWKDSLKGLSVTLGDGDPSGVRVMDVSSARGLSFPVVFLCGLTDGVFPRHEGSEWLYTAEEKGFLEANGVRLTEEKTSLAIEKFLFSMAVTRCKKELYLSYPLKGLEEEESPSPFLTEVLSLFEPEAIPFQRIDASKWLPDSYEYIASPAELSQMLIREASRGGRKGVPVFSFEVAEEISPSPSSISSPRGVVFTMDSGALRERWEWILLKIRAENERFGPQFSPFDGYIGGEKVCERLQERFGGTFRFSAGQFRDYALCPFYFFLGRVLNLIPWEEASEEGGIDSRGKGEIYHRVLARFLSRHSRSPLKRGEWQQYLTELEDLLEEVCEEYGLDRRLLHPGLLRIEKAQILRDLKRWLFSEIDDLEGSSLKWYPLQLEWSFGMMSGSEEGMENKRSTKNPLRLRRGDEEILLRGKVDRIDSHGDGRYSIYDYKTSRGATFNEMEDGLDLQVPIYLKAVQDLFCSPEEVVVGGGYYSLKEGRRAHGLWRESVAPDLLFRRSKRLGNLSDDEWEAFFRGVEERLFEMRQRILKGDFSLRPARCLSYCPFTQICRYERRRIQGKGEGSASTETKGESPGIYSGEDVNGGGGEE